MLDIAKPATQTVWPDIVRLRMVRDGGRWKWNLPPSIRLLQGTHTERIAGYCQPMYPDWSGSIWPKPNPTGSP